MSTVQKNIAFIHRYLDAISGKAKPPALIDQFVSDRDPALKLHIAGAEAAFPHYEMRCDDVIAQGDKVVVRFTLRGTHRGDFMGLPATSKMIDVPGIIIYQIADGKIVHHWDQLDGVNLLQQLGAIPKNLHARPAQPAEA